MPGVINKLGQVIASNNYDHAGGTSSQKILVGNLLANGIFIIEITNPYKSTKLINILVQ
ncbi:MAG: hypothetical protein H7334_11000 [Ferruginibacter sp.]|nr:hypothetical protein [Ferruginibacter sp.]